MNETWQGQTKAEHAKYLYGKIKWHDAKVWEHAAKRDALEEALNRLEGK